MQGMEFMRTWAMEHPWMAFILVLVIVPYSLHVFYGTMSLLFRTIRPSAFHPDNEDEDADDPYYP